MSKSVMSIKVKEVIALDDFMLDVLFKNGQKKLYDVKQLFLEFPQMFAPLKENPSLFKNVSVDCGGCGISWNEDIDISEWELWDNGVMNMVKNMGDEMYYKGYTGSIEFSKEDGLFFGKVLGIKALISYEGETKEALVQDFHDGVDDYLLLCEDDGIEPEKG